MPAHDQSKTGSPPTDRGGLPACHALKIPGLRITADGRLAIDLNAPTFHTMVFGSALVGLTRIVLAPFGELPTSGLAVAYLTALASAFTLSRVAARMKERTPRLTSSTISVTVTVLGVNLAPGFPSTVTPTAASSLLALGAIGLLALGTAAAEVLHRIGSRPAPESPAPESEPVRPIGPRPDKPGGAKATRSKVDNRRVSLASAARKVAA